MTNLGYLFAAFALAWALAFLYMLTLARRSAAVEKQLETLEGRIRKAVDES